MQRYGEVARFIVSFALLICAGALWAAEIPKTPDQKENAAAETAMQRPLRIEVPLVLVQISVIDPYNRFVTGLEKEHFEVFEDKQSQPIAHFSTEDVPLLGFACGSG